MFADVNERTRDRGMMGLLFGLRRKIAFLVGLM